MKEVNGLWASITDRIESIQSPVLLRKDFSDLGSYDWVGRNLNKLIQKDKLVRIGYGLYAKAKRSALTGEIVPIVPLPTLGKEALKRLGFETFPTEAEVKYEEGSSTQVPTGRSIGVKDRISRKIGFGDAYISFEYVPNIPV